LDAFQSRWSSRFSFGNMFLHALRGIFPEILEDTLKVFGESLDKKKVYAFLVRSNQENRVVCRSPPHTLPKQKIVYLGYWSTQKFFFSTLSKEEGKGGEKEEKEQNMLSSFALPVASSFILKGATKEELFSWMENHLNIWEHQGLLLFRPSTMETVRIALKEYQKFSKLRGNHPNLFFRYFQIRHSKPDVIRFCELYEKQAHIFDDYEHALFQSAKQIAHLYIQRYIKDKYDTLPKEEYYLLKKCHEWYLEDRVKNRVHTRTILELLNKEAPIVLFRLARKYLPPRNHTKSESQRPSYVPSEFPDLSTTGYQNINSYNRYPNQYKTHKSFKSFKSYNNSINYDNKTMNGRSYADILLETKLNSDTVSNINDINNTNNNNDINNINNLPSSSSPTPIASMEATTPIEKED
jgi:hypothetical protein